ncbi:MAG: tRNA (N(6)-L-threonylcarbamoyladenosine(37)-C(2))-methylthiotransferase MtaB [Oscillospiraceae bacterium]
MTVYFITFGCKVSCYETECMKELFENNGYTISENEKDSDIFIINSCTVTAMSDKKVRQTLHRIRHENPDAVIAVTGCFPQAFPEKADTIAEADIITGTKNHTELLELVKKAVDEKISITAVKPFEKNETIEHISCSSYDDKTRAFVKIQDGCNQFCSYCIIPYARGRNRSKPLDELKNEISVLAGHGHKEIVLVGINLAFYGEEFGISLADAVEVCCNISGVERVRLGSLEPEKLTDDILIRLAGMEKFCPQFHISLQSGCDKTLENMNRKYTSAEYEQLVTRIRGLFPDCAVTTDVMVGFPMETDEDFIESMEFVKKIGFSQIHVFPYSRRSGTRADKFSGQLTKAVKQKRAAEMTAVGREMYDNFCNSQIGKVFPVLFEKETSAEYHQGYTPNYTYVKVKADGNESWRRKIFNVKITGYDGEFCIGKRQGAASGS